MFDPYIIQSTPIANSRALVIDSNTKWVSIGNTGITGNWTISIWVYNKFSTSPIHYVLNTKDGRGGIFVEYGAQSDKWGFYDGTTIAIANTNLNENQWYFLTVTNVGGSYKFYVNGVADGSKTMSNTAISDLIIGRRADTISLTPIADFGELSVWNKELSLAEILEAKGLCDLTTHSAAATNLNNYYGFKATDISGTTLIDRKANKNGVLVGSPTFIDTACPPV